MRDQVIVSWAEGVATRGDVATRYVGLLATIMLEARHEGVPTDPDALTLHVSKPGLAVSEATPTVHTGPGRFQATVRLDRAGRWLFAVEATGPVQASKKAVLYAKGRRT